MHNLIPHFIANTCDNDIYSGTFKAASLYMDISGFTPLTEALMQTRHRKQGVEALTDALHRIFAPLVKQVYLHNGFVNTFAGDAFIAFFPKADDSVNRDVFAEAIRTAFLIQEHIQENRVLHTPYGDFEINVKVGLGFGQVEWEIIKSDKRHSYYMMGEAVTDCTNAEALAKPGEIIVSSGFYENANTYLEAEVVGIGYRVSNHDAPQITYARTLDSISPATMSKFAPQLIVNYDLHAEFRDVVNIFIKFDIDQDRSAITQFIQTTMLNTIEYGGYFRQIEVGDKGAVIVCLFGAPVSYENNIKRAADFLLNLRKETETPWRAGMTFGMTYVGFVGGEERSDFASVGDVVNLAARLMGRAEYGEIRVHAPIVEALESLGYQFSLIGNLDYKGKSGKIPTSLLLDKEGVFIGDFNKKGAIVARKAELDSLLGWCDPIFKGKFAGLGIVYGEAGIGKSRLITALHNNLQWTNPVQWLTCPTDEILQQSLNPFRSVLREYFDQSAGRQLEDNRSRFDTRFSALINGTTDETLRVRLERNKSFIAAFVELYSPESLYASTQGEVRFDNMLEAFKVFVLALCAQEPTILYIQDAHWLDTDSITLIERLVRDTDSAPFLVLMTSRYRDDTSKLDFDLTSQVKLSTLDLQPIDDAAVEELVQFHLEGTVNPELTAFIYQRTRGNPLFAEQLALHLREQRLLSYNTVQGWSLNNTEINDVPQNIRAVLIARLDRLAQEIRQIVQTASILGTEFDADILYGITIVDGGEKETTQQGVISAETAAIWSAITISRYAFRHMMMRDAAYTMQLNERLQTLHRLAALVIEDMQRKDLTPYMTDLAFHYRRAGDKEKEHKYALAAGERALANFANTDAIAYFSRALEITPEGEHQVRYDILRLREHAYDVIADRPAQLADLDMLDTLVEIIQDDIARVEVLLRRCEYAGKTSDIEMWRTASENALAVTRNLQKPTLEANALIQYGHLNAELSDYENAHDAYNQALAICEPLDEKHILTRIYHALGNFQNRSGKQSASIESFEQALNLARDIGDEYSEANILINYSHALQYLGEYQRSKTFAERSVEIFEAIGDKHNTARAFNQLGVVLASSGQLAEAVPIFERTYRIFREVGDRRGAARTFMNLGNVAYFQGDFETSAKNNIQAIENFRKLKDVFSESHGLANVGHYFRYLWRYEESEQWIKDAITLCHKIGNGQTEADSYNNLGDLYRTIARFDDALNAFDSAIAIYEDLQNNEGISNSKAAKVLLYIYMGDLESARATAQESLDLAVTLDNPYVLPAAQTMLGHVLTISKKYERAIEYYRQAVDNRRGFGEEDLAMEPLAGLLRVALLQDNGQRIQQHTDELYTFLIQGALGIAEDPIWVYLSCYDGLIALAENAKAQDILNRAGALLTKMEGLLTGEALSRFNTLIPSHKRLNMLKPQKT